MNEKREFPRNSMLGRWEADDSEGFGFEVVEHASERPVEPVEPRKGEPMGERTFWLPKVTDPRTEK